MDYYLVEWIRSVCVTRATRVGEDGWIGTLSIAMRRWTARAGERAGEGREGGGGSARTTRAVARINIFGARAVEGGFRMRREGGSAT